MNSVDASQLQNQGVPDYRIILRSELAERCKHNPNYSLRAFARDLGIAPSRVSEILSGKQGLSRKAALSIAERLGLSTEEAEAFADLVDCRHCRTLDGRERARRRLGVRPFRNRELQQDI